MMRLLRVGWPWVVLALIVLLGGWFASYRLAEPAWEMNHHGYILSEWPHNALNYVRFGYLSTRLGLVMDYGWLRPPEGFQFRIDHPPLSSLLMSLSYLALGVREWSARLVPLLLSLGVIVLVFMLARQIAGRGWALLAASFAALCPALVYFARLTVPHVPAVFFALLTFVLYRKWVVEGSRKYMVWMWVAFVVGAWTDWIVYFVMPWVLIHYVLFHYRQSRNRVFVAVSLVLPLALFAVYIAWAWGVGGTKTLLRLLEIFQFRTFSISPEYRQKYVFTAGEFYQLSYGWIKLFFTSVLCGLSIIWLISFIARAAKRRVSSDEFLILCLFLYGLMHNLVFRNRVYIHDFAMVFQWIPFFAVAGMMGTRALAEWVIPRWRIPVLAALIPLVLAGLAAESRANVIGLHREKLEPGFYLAGRQISEMVPRDARVMLSFVPDIRLRYYVDRPWVTASTLDEFQARLKEDPAYSYFVLGPGAPPVAEPLRRHLVTTYPVRNCGEYAVFDLKGTGPRVVGGDLAGVSHATEVRFGEKLLLTGYDLEPVVRAPERGEISFGEQHFNAHAEWMPQHQATFRMTYYWQCLGPVNVDYRIAATFVADYGEQLTIDQTHWPANGAYPTSLWREGDLVREQYVVSVPAGSPPLRYALRLSVVDPATNEAVAVRSPKEPVSTDGRSVTLGGVDVAPDQPPVGQTDVPRMQEQLVQDVGNNLVLQGYDWGNGFAAGQTIPVATYWRCDGAVSEDVPVWAELVSGEAKVRSLLGIEPTRLWQAGHYYVRRGEMAISPYLLPGSYELDLVMGGSTPRRLKLRTVEIGWAKEARRVIDAMGVANLEKGDVRPLDTDRPLQLNLKLDRPTQLDVVVGWTGEALCDETWVEAYLKNQNAERYLTTWRIPKGKYGVSSIHVPAGLTAGGANTLILRVPEARPKPHYVGWRAWLDALLPDLLSDSSGPHDGWIWADFAQVSAGELDRQWAAYRDLAQTYDDLKMYGEVGRLFERAVAAGLRPQRAEDLNVFVNALDKLGNGEGQAKVQEILQGLVPHPLGLNLDDQIEVVGYAIERVDDELGRLRLVWRCLKPLEADYTVWLHQYGNAAGQEGAFVALDHQLKTSLWKPGWVYEDWQTFKVGTGQVRFVFGVWRGEEGTRLELKGQPGQHEIDLGWMEPHR